MAPTLIIRGEKDQHVLLHQAKSFTHTALRAGAEARLIITPVAGSAVWRSRTAGRT